MPRTADRPGRSQPVRRSPTATPPGRPRPGRRSPPAPPPAAASGPHKVKRRKSRTASGRGKGDDLGERARLLGGEVHRRDLAPVLAVGGGEGVAHAAEALDRG